MDKIKPDDDETKTDERRYVEERERANSDSITQSMERKMHGGGEIVVERDYDPLSW
jgi:hypothetical protein